MDEAWPRLDYAEWKDTAATLQLWTQIVGKVRLSLTPWLNHSWQVPLYVTARGLGTSAIPVGKEIIEIEFDFIEHRLSARTSAGAEASFALAPQSVATFVSSMRTPNDSFCNWGTIVPTSMLNRVFAATE